MPTHPFPELHNQTGLQVSPLQARELLATQEALPVPRPVTADAEALRRPYLWSAGPLGSVPAPVSQRGMARAGIQTPTGARPQVLIDTLCERLAFERGSVRLYDAMLRKCETVTLPALLSIDELRRMRDEELAHAELLVHALLTLGSDPTALTPGAVVAGIEISGLLQVLNEPRATPTQCLHALLVAELSDVSSWDHLIQLAQSCRQTELVLRFEPASHAETAHAERVSRWYRDALLGDLQWIRRH